MKYTVELFIKKADDLLYMQDFNAAEEVLLNAYDSFLKSDLHSALSIQNELVGFYRKMGKKDYGLKAIDLCEALLHKLNIEHSNAAGDIYLNCGTALTEFNELERTENYFIKAKEIYSKVYPENHKNTASLYNNWGLALLRKGETLRARALFQKSTNILENIDFKLELAMSCLSLADTYDMEHDGDIIDGLITKSYACFNYKHLIKDGYYSFVASKCIPSFEYYGFFIIAKDLKRRVEEINARN